MPEGMEGGYQPSAEELQTGSENPEAMGITEEPTEKGIQLVDAAGNIVDRTETWNKPDGPETQTIKYTYLEDGVAAVEDSKITAGEKAGWELRREHPMLPCTVDLSWYDEDLEMEIPVKATAIVEDLGQTIKGVADREPYAHLIITDQDALDAFADVTVKPGESYGKIEKIQAREIPLAVNGRNIIIKTIHQASVDVDQNRRPVKVTLHSRDWVEAPAEV